jgi:hypothetical protein
MEWWRKMFSFKSPKAREADAITDRVTNSQQAQLASYNRLEITIQRVIDAKNNRRSDGKNSDNH